MFCTRCGNSAREQEKKYCTKCGLKLRQVHTSATPVANTKEVVSEKKTSLSGQNREFFESLVGRTIDQRYTLESPIGFGAMGAVYRARRVNIGDTAAIKILKPEHTADPRSVERFQREAQVGAKLRHPNVATVYDFGVSEDNLVYFAMELVDGDDLRTMLVKNGPIAQSVAVEIMTQVCAGLEEAHRNEVVHRDLKPENIIVRKSTSGLEAKVLDFGVASFRNLNQTKLTAGDGLIGTPHYMSPEQWLGSAVDRRSDIYSLGLILFEMLSGRAPFAMINPADVLAPPALRNVNPNISAEIEAVVMHALEKDPTARPQSADEFARELRAALRGYHPNFFVQQTVPEHRVAKSAKPRPAAPQKRASFMQMAILVILLGASATGGGLWWAKKNAPANAQTIEEAETLNNQLIIPSPSKPVDAPTPEPVASPAKDVVAPLPVKPSPTVKPIAPRRPVAPVKIKKEQPKKPEAIKKQPPKNVISQDADDRGGPRFRDDGFRGDRWFGGRTHGYGDGMGWLRERWARERAYRWGYRRGLRNAAEASDSDSRDEDKERARRRKEREDR